MLPFLRGSALTGDNLLLQKEAKLGRTKLSTRQMTEACIKQMHRAQKVKIFEVKKKKSVERFFFGGALVGCGTLDRVVAFNANSSGFKSSHWPTSFKKRPSSSSFHLFSVFSYNPTILQEINLQNDLSCGSWIRTHNFQSSASTHNN